MVKKGNQIKCYLDQYRVLVMPDCGDCKVSFLEVGGIGSQDAPIIFKNFRLAEGGGMNMIGQILKDNPEIKFEIDGHTDNSGAAAHNQMLSQQRADAVKTQLVSMGVDAGRLTSKGFGDAKPISDKNSPDGKANNRRVEFVKTSN